jgi:hypothetical protein
MNSTSPATSVLDEVRTWPGVSTRPTPRVPRPSCLKATSLAMSMPTAAPSTFRSLTTGLTEAFHD